VTFVTPGPGQSTTTILHLGGGSGLDPGKAITVTLQLLVLRPDGISPFTLTYVKGSGSPGKRA